MAEPDIVRLYLNGVQQGTVLCSVNDNPVFNVQATGTVEKTPLNASLWSQIQGLGGMTQTVSCEVEYEVGTTLRMPLQQYDLWRRTFRQFAQKRVDLRFYQAYTESNACGSDIVNPSSHERYLPFGSQLCTNVLPGQLHGSSFCSLLFTFEVTEAGMMTSDYMFQNADFSIELAQGTPVERTPESWTLTNPASTSGGLGVSRVTDDDNTWGLFFSQGAAPVDTFAMQEWTCPAYAPSTQEVAFCVQVQPRVNVADLADPDQPMIIRLSRVNVGARLYQNQLYKVSSNVGQTITLRLVFTVTPAGVSQLSFGVPALDDGGVKCDFVVKRAWIEIVKAQ